MKKIILVLVVLTLAAPAWAEVLITCACSNDEVTVSYDASSEGTELVRAFALDVFVDSEAIIQVDSVGNFNADYGIYPGSIVIVGDAVTDAGSPVCDAGQYPGTTEPGPGTGSMTIEMGSLYEEGVDPPPDASGVLFTFTVDKDCNVTITENAARGGVVMEDPDLSVDFNSPGCTTDLDCLIVDETIGGVLITQDMYDLWVTLDKPDCWCYDCHWRGDTDGNCTVNNDDIWDAVDGWDDYNDTNPDGLCADTDNNGTVNNDDIWNIIDGWDIGCGDCTPLP